MRASVTMTEEREPEPGLHGQHLLGANLSVKTDGQELLRGARAATAWGLRGCPGGCGACHPHILHILWQCAQA